MRRRNRKGFTIVELVIVIAVIGILAAILIPTFVNITAQARDTYDTSLVKNLNTTLAVGRAKQGEANHTMRDALDDALDGGFTVEKITPRGAKDIVWDSVNDEFVLMNEEPATKAAAVRYFKIYKSFNDIPAAGSQKYSIYLDDLSERETLTVSVGFDSGKNENIRTVNYVNVPANESDPGQTVTLRTLNSNLNVNGPKDTVHHYQVAEELLVTAVDDLHSYHEHGVAGKATLEQGHFVVENTGFIGKLSQNTAAAKSIVVKGTIMAKDETVTTPISGEGNYPGSPTPSNVLKAESFEQLQGYALACNLGTTFEGYIIRLEKDIDFEGRVWIPFGIYSEVQGWENNSNICLQKSRFFKGCIDGNGHTIKKLSNRGYKTDNLHYSLGGTVGANYGLIALATGNVTIKNITVDFDLVDTTTGEEALNCVGIIGQYFAQDTEPIVKHYYDESTESWKTQPHSSFNDGVYAMTRTTVRFEDVTTTGNISSIDGASAFIGTDYGSTQPQLMDATGIREWRGAKWAWQSKDDRLNGTITDAKSFALSDQGCGWFAEPFGTRTGHTSIEVTFKDGDDVIPVTGGNYVSFAPYKVSYEFVRCQNSARIEATTKRAGVFFGKHSNGTGMKLSSLVFTECVNSGDIYCKNAQAAVVAGFFAANITEPLPETIDITNTGTVYRNHGTVSPSDPITGVDALLP